LGNVVAAGAYQYQLFYGGIGADANNQNWYLRDTVPVTPPVPPSAPTSPATPTPTPAPISTVPIYRSEVPIYLAMPEIANQMGFAMIDNLQAREGDDYALPVAAPAPVETVWCKDPKVHFRCVVKPDQMKYYKDQKDKEIEAIQQHMVWGRVFGYTGWQKPGDTGLNTGNAFLNGKGPEYSFALGGMQVGVDLYHVDRPDGSKDRAGVYVVDKLPVP